MASAKVAVAEPDRSRSAKTAARCAISMISNDDAPSIAAETAAAVAAAARDRQRSSVGWNRGLAGSRDNLFQPVRAIKDTNGRDPNGRSTSIVAVSHACGVACLMELPERSKTRMNALDARQQFAADARVPHVAVLANCPRHSDRPLGVVRSLADAPLALPIADVARDGCSWRPLEPVNAARIPSENVLAGQHLRLLSNRVTCCDPLQTGKNPLFN